MSQTAAKLDAGTPQAALTDQAPAPRPVGGQPLCTAERRAELVAAALVGIEDGRTLADIAVELGLTRRTLRAWLYGLGEAAVQSRRLWLDSMLADSHEAIECADDSLSLARAREQWRCASWLAERRDAARYGARQDPTTVVQVNGQATISPSLDPIEAARLYRQLVGEG